MKRQIARFATALTIVLMGSITTKASEPLNVYVGVVDRDMGAEQEPASRVLSEVAEAFRDALQNKFTHAIARVQTLSSWDVVKDWEKTIGTGPHYSHYVIAVYETGRYTGIGRAFKVKWHVGHIVNAGKDDGYKLTFFGTLKMHFFITRDGEEPLIKFSPDDKGLDANETVKPYLEQFAKLFPETQGAYRYFVNCFDGEPEAAANRLTKNLWDVLETGDLLRAVRTNKINLNDIRTACNNEADREKSDVHFSGSLRPGAAPGDHIFSVQVDNYQMWKRREESPFCLPYRSTSDDFDEKTKQAADKFDTRFLRRKYEDFCAPTAEVTSERDGFVVAQKLAIYVTKQVFTQQVSGQNAQPQSCPARTK